MGTSKQSINAQEYNPFGTVSDNNGPISININQRESGSVVLNGHYDAYQLKKDNMEN